MENQCIRLPKVLELVGIKKSTVWLWVSQGKFPKPIKLSPRVTVWKLNEIVDFINSKTP